MEFGILCSLEVSHTYYGDTCRNVEVVIPEETSRILRGTRMIARMHEDRLHLLFEKDEGEAFLPEAGTVLRLGFASTDPAFATFTALPFTPGTGVFFLANNGAKTFGPALVPAPIGSSFSHRVKLAERPVAVALATAAGETVETATVAETGEAAVGYRLPRRPPGLYTVREKAAGKTAETLYYLHDEFARRQIFAVVELVIDPTWPKEEKPPVLHLPLAARQEVFSYYIVGEKCDPPDMADLSIEDAGDQEQKRDKVTFAAAPVDDLALSLIDGRHAQVAVFRSTKPVPRVAAARRKIRLLKKNQTFIDNLPQPGGAAPTSNVIFHFTKG